MTAEPITADTIQQIPPHLREGYKQELLLWAVQEIQSLKQGQADVMAAIDDLNTEIAAVKTEVTTDLSAIAAEVTTLQQQVANSPVNQDPAIIAATQSLADFVTTIHAKYAPPAPSPTPDPAPAPAPAPAS